MFKFLQLNPKYKSIVTRVISSLIFALLFVLVCIVFEFAYRGSVTNQINKLIHEILLFGL
jgi:uncharacterized membrane protein YGL010W